MAVSEEESSSSSSSSSNYKSRSASGPHYLAKTVLRGTVVLQVVPGHFRSPSSNDVVLAKVSYVSHFIYLQISINIHKFAGSAQLCSIH